MSEVLLTLSILHTVQKSNKKQTKNLATLQVSIYNKGLSE
jgi:hypothetical protein